MGAVDADLLFEAVDAVAAEDPKGVLFGVEKMARSGRDPAQFARDLLAHLRLLLVTQTIGEVPNTFVVTATDSDRLATQAAAISAAALIRTIDELAAALTAVREGDDARMAVEIALLKAARPDLDPSTEGLLRRVERLEQGTSVAGPRVLPREEGPAGGAAAPFSAPPPAPPAAEADSPGLKSPPEAESPPQTEGASPAGGTVGGPTPEEALATGGGGGSPAATGPAGQSALDLDEVVRIWPAVLDKLRETSPALAATFEGARPVSFDDEGLKVGFPAEFTFNKRKAEAADKRELMADALEAVVGERLRPTYVLLDVEAVPEAAPGEEIDHDALVERLKSEFDAEEVG
jgi:DNA polymerase-3 subunit gamma/tau